MMWLIQVLLWILCSDIGLENYLRSDALIHKSVPVVTVNITHPCDSADLTYKKCRNTFSSALCICTFNV